MPVVPSSESRGRYPGRSEKLIQVRFLQNRKSETKIEPTRRDARQAAAHQTEHHRGIHPSIQTWNSRSAGVADGPGIAPERAATSARAVRDVRDQFSGIGANQSSFTGLHFSAR